MTIERPHLGWWLSIVAGMAVLTVLAFVPAALAWWMTHLFWLPPAWVLKCVFAGAVGIHVFDATLAFRVARNGVAPTLAMGWMMQTLVLGWPSLRLLLRRRDTMKQAR